MTAPQDALTYLQAMIAQLPDSVRLTDSEVYEVPTFINRRMVADFATRKALLHPDVVAAVRALALYHDTTVDSLAAAVQIQSALKAPVIQWILAETRRQEKETGV